MDRFLGVAFWAIVGPLFWVLAMAIPLWLIRRYAPRAEWWLYTPLTRVIGRLAGSTRGRLRRAARADRDSAVR